MTMSQTTYSDEDMHTCPVGGLIDILFYYCFTGIDDLSEDDLSEDDPSPDDLSQDGRSSTQIYVGAYIFPKFQIFHRNFPLNFFKVRFAYILLPKFALPKIFQIFHRNFPLNFFNVRLYFVTEICSAKNFPDIAP